MHRLPQGQRRLFKAFECQTGLIGLATFLLPLARANLREDQYITWTQVPPYKSAHVPATQHSTAWRVYVWEPISCA